MTEFEQTLLAGFCCVKCRGKTAVTKNVQLAGLSDLLRLSPGSYILISCTICGYSELYNPHAFAKGEQPARESESLAQET